MPQGYDEQRRREREYDTAENESRGDAEGRSPGYDQYASVERWNLPAGLMPQGDQTVNDWMAALGGPDNYARAINERDREFWQRLDRIAPSLGELSPDYLLEAASDEYGDLGGGDSRLEGLETRTDDAHQAASLRALENLYRSGGYTSADRAQSAALRQQQAQGLRAQNAAAIQAAQARGMGGGGAQLAAQMGASEAMAGAGAVADAQLQAAAQQRALAALSGAGSLSSQMRGQRQGDVSAEMQRRGALDAYNQQNLDWRRGRESRNTGIANQGARDRADAYQQRFQNAVTTTEGATQFNTSEQQERRDQFQRGQQTAAGAAGFIQGLF